ncbi:MAG: trypsin-like peptidase domain-containing protein [Candidatus Dependentiae bacterium]|nr:trypsin-like peptidase domain-containing protein [Candidatus Dependentiae bacterium]
MNKKKSEYADASCWGHIDALAQNAVVQVFAQVLPFNWIQPYRIETPFESRGSGFFITPEGHFITNAHVVNDARRIWVHIPILGIIPLPAMVVGICPELDVALARLQTEALAFVKQQLGKISYFEYGNSDKVKPTESVLALGYPLGQNHVKSTTGVVSGREFLNGRPLIQITAPVNPGNSGGPLVGVDGKVLGVTVSGVLAAQSIGYVIPINELKGISDELMAGGLVRMPKLGISLGYANDQKALFFHNPEPAGLYICGVIPGSLCDNAGVHEGDMLYELNGHAIDAYGESTVSGGFGRLAIYDLIVNIKRGQKVTMVVYRAGQRITISFIYELQQPLPIRRLYAGYEPIDYEVIGGLVLMPLTDDHMELLVESSLGLLVYNVPKNRVQGAVVITYIFAGSYAHHTHSLLPGDIIKYVNDIRVTDLDSFRKALRKSIETGLIAIKTENDALVVLSLSEVLRDEPRLSADFIYPLSQTITQLQDVVLPGTLKEEA